MRNALALVVIVLISPGCATFQDWHYSTVNCLRSECAWFKSAKHPKCVIYPSDYGHGWKQGYLCVAMGGAGHPPTLPPKKYWSACYQTPEGQKAIASWYSGFENGAMAAERRGAGQFHYLRPYGMAAASSDGAVGDFPPPEVATEVPDSGTTPPASEPQQELVPPASSRRVDVPPTLDAAPQQPLDGASIPSATPWVQTVSMIERLPPCNDRTTADSGLSPDGALRSNFSAAATRPIFR